MKRHEKPVSLTRYGRERMRARGIARSLVEEAVRCPDRIRKARIPTARLFEKRVSAARRLLVIADEQDEVIHIINAYWHTKPRRKRR